MAENAGQAQTEHLNLKVKSQVVLGLNEGR